MVEGKGNREKGKEEAADAIIYKERQTKCVAPQQDTPSVTLRVTAPSEREPKVRTIQKAPSPRELAGRRPD